MKKLKFLIRGTFWEAFLIWQWRIIQGYPEYTYGWWRSRTRLIMKGKI